MSTGVHPHASVSRPSAVTLAALVPAFALIIGFTGSVGWMRNPLPLLMLIVWAVIVAVGLATSRFSAPGAFAFSLVLSIGLVLLITGKVVPPPRDVFGRDLSQTLWYMNVRLWTFLDDVRRGAEAPLSGSSPGSALATALYGLLVWQTVTWLVWASLRRRAAWPATLLCFGLVAARDLLASRPPAWSMGMTFAVLVFAASATYAATVDSWERHGLGYPMLIWETWTVALTGIAAIVFVVTGLTTPSWRDSIRRFIDRAREVRESTATTSGDGTAQLRSSFVPDLADLGTPFPLGKRTIFYVRTSDSPSGADIEGPIAPPSDKRYWRGAIYAAYTGRGWEMAQLGEPAPPMAGLPADLSRRPLRQQFDIPDLRDDRLFAASQPVVASEGLTLHAVGDDGMSSILRGVESKYSVVSWIPRVTRDQLRAAGSDYPNTIRSTYLQLPEEVPQRVRTLASGITAGSDSPYEKAVRVQEYLRANFVYRDDPPAPPTGGDVVDYFLFDAPGGYCSYFASAMVVMLRLEGVPSRVVTGFATGTWQGLDGRYRVAESDAHAWVEVYFPGYGWIEFEPTSSRSPFEYFDTPASAAAPTSPSTFGEATSSIGRALSVGVRIVTPMLSAALLVALLARHRSRGRPAPESLLHDLYWEMRRIASGDGRAHLTPSEFASRHEEKFTSLPRLRLAAGALTSLYIQSTYASRGPAPWEVERARRAWRAAWWDRARMRWQLRSDYKTA